MRSCWGRPSAGDISGSDSGRVRVVHLVGVPHPAPWKGEAFRRVDLGSLRSSLAAERFAGAAKFVYVSVAQPAPVMEFYLEVRPEL